MMAADLYIYVGPGEGDLASREQWERPSVWIGEVSWLKAAFLGEPEMWIPAPVRLISDLLNGPKTLTDELRDAIVSAMGAENTSALTISNAEKVKAFLDEHVGETIYPVSA